MSRDRCDEAFQTATKRRTRSAGVGLDKLVLGAGLGELGPQPGELGQDLVDYTDFGGEVVLVDVEGEEAANVAQPPDDEDRGLLVSHGWWWAGAAMWERGEVGSGLGVRRCSIQGARGCGDEAVRLDLGMRPWRCWQRKM